MSDEQLATIAYLGALTVAPHLWRRYENQLEAAGNRFAAIVTPHAGWVDAFDRVSDTFGRLMDIPDRLTWSMGTMIATIWNTRIYAMLQDRPLPLRSEATTTPQHALRRQTRPQANPDVAVPFLSFSFRLKLVSFSMMVVQGDFPKDLTIDLRYEITPIEYRGLFDDNEYGKLCVPNDTVTLLATRLKDRQCPAGLRLNLENCHIYGEGLTIFIDALRTGLCPLGLTILNQPLLQADITEQLKRAMKPIESAESAAHYFPDIDACWIWLPTHTLSRPEWHVLKTAIPAYLNSLRFLVSQVTQSNEDGASETKEDEDSTDSELHDIVKALEKCIVCMTSPWIEEVYQVWFSDRPEDRDNYKKALLALAGQLQAHA